MTVRGSLIISIKATLKTRARLMKSVLSSLVCFVITFTPLLQAQALELQLNSKKNLRMLNANNQEYVANLAAGSVVEIPDQFKVTDRNGNVDTEQSLYRWLKQAGGYGTWGDGHSPGYYKLAESGGDYYYPITVKKIAEGSLNADKIESGKSYFMALGGLAIKKDLLVVTQSAPLMNSIPGAAPVTIEAKPAPVPTQAQQQIQRQQQLEAGCAVCSSPSHTMEAPRSNDLQDLMRFMQPALSQADKQMQLHEIRTVKDLKDIRSRFQATCGISLDAYLPEVQRQADEAGVPAHVLLSIMTQESSGDCSQVTPETVGVSVGLFQIHESIFRQCSSYELQQMQGASIARLQRGPRCLQNPVVNLQEGIRVMKQKLEALLQPSTRYSIDRYSRNGGTERVNVAISGFDPRQLRTPDGHWNATMWRMVASAYNGGEGWVLRAKRDLEMYNERNGTNLNPANWEDLRVFYLKRELNSHGNAPENFFGQREVGRRVDRATLNLSYAENVEPRDRRYRSGSDYTLSDRWEQILSDSQKRPDQRMISRNSTYQNN